MSRSASRAPVRPHQPDPIRVTIDGIVGELRTVVNILTQNIKIDNELKIRIGRLGSSIKQARHDAAKITDDAARAQRTLFLDELSAVLAKAGEPAMELDNRMPLVFKVEAELCMVVPLAVLGIERNRYQDRLYRLSAAEKDGWTELLGKYKAPFNTPEIETEYRQILRRLVYEVTGSAEAYERVARESAMRFLLILLIALAAFLILVCFFVSCLTETLDLVRQSADQSIYVRALPGGMVITLMLAGSIGAMITVVPSILTTEKPRAGSIWTLMAVLANMLLRTAFGAVYAIFVVLALLAGVLPLQPSNEKGLLMFLVLAGVAAGVSDKFFGRVISAIITGKDQPESKSAAKTSGRRGKAS